MAPRDSREQTIWIGYGRTKELYRKCIGTYVGSDGKVRPRIFWLGPNGPSAQLRAETFHDYHNRWLRGKLWTKSDERHVEQLVQDRLRVNGVMR